MQIDVIIVSFLNGLAGQSSAADFLIVFFAHYFPYLVALVFAVFVWKHLASQREKLWIACEGIAAALISRFVFVELIRAFFHRTRPFVDHTLTSLLAETSYSFPSGHAAFFFALATVVYLYNKSIGLWFFGSALLIGIARIVAGVHYTSDILGGAVLGMLVGYAVHVIRRKILKRNRDSLSATQV